MAINITKLKENNTNKVIPTPYGEIEVTDNVNLDVYTYFDTFNDYNLYIDEMGDNAIAMKVEDVVENTNFIENDLQLIKDKYNVETVKYDSTTPAIIIKVSENNVGVINEISNDFKDNDNYKVNVITPQVLFLEPVNMELQLEDDDLLNKLDDNSIKDLAKKTGATLSGSESKDELKGIIKGALSSNK